jgi:hypothetical protein
MVDYEISDIQERLFFIKEKIQRDKINILCNFATRIQCVRYLMVKERIQEIGDSYIIENVLNGTFDLVIENIFSKKLWSEGY